MRRTRENIRNRPATRYRTFNGNNENDNISSNNTLTEHEGNGPPNNNNESGGSTGDVKALPVPLFLLASEWLFTQDVLELGRVDRSFREISKESSLWQGIACHLWKAALVDWNGSLVDMSHARLRKEAPADLTLQDLCRCMVGVWPTHITLTDRPWRALDAIQGIVNGTLQPIAESLPNLNGESSPQGAGAGAGASAGEAENEGGGGDDSGASRALTASTGSTTGVVFRGKLGGDRAVRANLPFPWMGHKDCVYSVEAISASFIDPFWSRWVATEDCHGGESMLMYPHALLGRVRSGSPFGTLWPGHAKANSIVANPGAECSSAGVSSSGGGGSGSNDDEDGHALADGEVDEDSWAKLERLPSSGPAPFFRAGYTAYFEITLGQPLQPLAPEEEEEGAPAGFFGEHVDQCVAIGLATKRFQLIGKQPGWDSLSWGFHSDDGLLHHKGYASTPRPTKFGPGDTVGCGLLYPPAYAYYRRCDLSSDDRLLPSEDRFNETSEGAIFFTKNGRFLGIAFREIDVQKPLYPCVGLDSHYPVEFNFGTEAFAFDLPRFEQHIVGGGWPKHPDRLEPPDLAASIRRCYCAESGPTNPRLLLPRLRLAEAYNNWQMEPRNTSDERVLESESGLLRACLASVKVCDGFLGQAFGGACIYNFFGGGDEDDDDEDEDDEDEDDEDDEDDDDEDEDNEGEDDEGEDDEGEDDEDEDDEDEDDENEDDEDEDDEDEDDEDGGDEDEGDEDEDDEEARIRSIYRYLGDVDSLYD